MGLTESILFVFVKTRIPLSDDFGFMHLLLMLAHRDSSTIYRNLNNWNTDGSFIMADLDCFEPLECFFPIVQENKYFGILEGTVLIFYNETVGCLLSESQSMF